MYGLLYSNVKCIKNIELNKSYTKPQKSRTTQLIVLTSDVETWNKYTVKVYSRTSMARTSLGPRKLVRDRGSSSQ